MSDLGIFLTILSIVGMIGAYFIHKYTPTTL